MKGRILLASVGLMAACTSVTDVNSRRDGHLVVVSRARWDFVSWNRVKNAGIDEARSYCHKRKKQLHAVDLHTEGVRGVTKQTVEVTFECF